MPSSHSASHDQRSRQHLCRRRLHRPETSLPRQQSNLLPSLHLRVSATRPLSYFAIVGAPTARPCSVPQFRCRSTCAAATNSPTTEAPRADMATWTCLTRAECSVWPPLGCCGDERRLGNGSSVNCGTKACLTYSCKRNGATVAESECPGSRPPIALDTFNIVCGLSCFKPTCFYTRAVQCRCIAAH